MIYNTVRFSGQNALNPNDSEEIKLLLLDDNENTKTLAMKVAPKTSNPLVMALIANRIKHQYDSIDTPIFPATQATLLHCAVSQGEPTVVEKLLQMGANPDKTDKNGDTAIDWLEKKFNPERPSKDREAIRHLLENPPELDVEPGWLSNPLPTLSSLAGSISSWLTKPTSDNQAFVAPADQETLEEIAPKTREVGVQVKDEEKTALLGKLISQQKESQRFWDSTTRQEGDLDALRRELKKQKDENARLQKALSGASRGTHNVQVQRDEARLLLDAEKAEHEQTRQKAQERKTALEGSFNAKIAKLMERLAQQGDEIQRHQTRNQSLQQDLDKWDKDLETEKRRGTTELDKEKRAHQATAKRMETQLEDRNRKNRKLQQELAASKAAHDKSLQQMQSGQQETEAGLKAQIEEVRQENRVLADKLKALESLREQSDAEKNSLIAEFEQERTRHQQERQAEQEKHLKSCTEIKRLEQEKQALEESRRMLTVLKQGLIDQKDARIQQLETERTRVTEALLQKDGQIRTLKVRTGQAEKESVQMKRRLQEDMEIMQASLQDIQAILDKTEQEIQQQNDPETCKSILLQTLHQIREENRITQDMLKQNDTEETEPQEPSKPRELKRSWSFS